MGKTRENMGKMEEIMGKPWEKQPV